MNNRKILLIVHGGAGGKRPTKSALKKLSEALLVGFDVLRNGGNAIDAVVESISILEDSGLFNAGIGGNLQFDGVRRLDASLMDGKDLGVGSIIGVEGVRNPIKLARIVMDLPHVIITNVGAKRIAEVHKLESLSEPDKDSLERLERIKKEAKEIVSIYRKYFSTVGAVSLDGYGNLAAGTSTGGILAMLPGRVGDTPVIGAGTYADNRLGAVSCTGTGEHIIRIALSKEICMNMKKMTPTQAVQYSLKRISKIGGEAGVIALNRKGKFAIIHTTRYMASGYANQKGIVVKEM